jgi:hypothetical protein
MTMFAIQQEPLDLATSSRGAPRRRRRHRVVLRHRAQREHGARVQYLEYDAYPEMARRRCEVADDVRAKFPIAEIGVPYRIGRLEIGETSLLVAVSAAIAEAFEACHYAVDRIKQLCRSGRRNRGHGSEWTRPSAASIKRDATCRRREARGIAALGCPICRSRIRSQHTSTVNVVANEARRRELGTALQSPSSTPEAIHWPVIGPSRMPLDSAQSRNNAGTAIGPMHFMPPAQGASPPTERHRRRR